MLLARLQQKSPRPGPGEEEEERKNQAAVLTEDVDVLFGPCLPIQGSKPVHQVLVVIAFKVTFTPVLSYVYFGPLTCVLTHSLLGFNSLLTV